jgi:hypothetical protein
VQTILLFLILLALSPGLARAFGKFIVGLALLFVAIVIAAFFYH